MSTGRIATGSLACCFFIRICNVNPITSHDGQKLRAMAKTWPHLARQICSVVLAATILPYNRWRVVSS